MRVPAHRTVTPVPGPPRDRERDEQLVALLARALARRRRHRAAQGVDSGDPIRVYTDVMATDPRERP